MVIPPGKKFRFKIKIAETNFRNIMIGWLPITSLYFLFLLVDDTDHDISKISLSNFDLESEFLTRWNNHLIKNIMSPYLISSNISNFWSSNFEPIYIPGKMWWWLLLILYTVKALQTLQALLLFMWNLLVWLILLIFEITLWLWLIEQELLVLYFDLFLWRLGWFVLSCGLFQSQILLLKVS